MHKEKELVDSLIATYKTTNPFEICQLKGYNLRYAPIGALNGMYRYSRKNVFITLNSNTDRYIQLAACAHELGHSIMHPQQNAVFMGSSTLFVTKKQEIEADRFSAYLQLKYYGDITLIHTRYLELIDVNILEAYI